MENLQPNNQEKPPTPLTQEEINRIAAKHNQDVMQDEILRADITGEKRKREDPTVEIIAPDLEVSPEEEARLAESSLEDMELKNQMEKEFEEKEKVQKARENSPQGQAELKAHIDEWSEKHKAEAAKAEELKKRIEEGMNKDSKAA